MQDPADEVASGGALPASTQALLGDRQAQAQAVAFYLHPTSDLSPDIHSAPADDPDARDRVESALRSQASVLNGVAAIWAPRYREVSLGTLQRADGASNGQAVAAAQADVEAAFDCFVRQTGDAPIFLLGHGQGAGLLVHLMKARLDGQPLAHRLVVAYLAGELVGTDTFAALPPCTTPDATGCFASWASVGVGTRPRQACGSADLSDCAGPPNTHRLPVACFNPLTGGGGAAPAAAHLGAGPGNGYLGGSFAGFSPALVGAACDAQGLLRIEPHEVEGISVQDFPGVSEGDYHSQDINLFYVNLRADAAARLHSWSEKYK